MATRSQRVCEWKERGLQWKRHLVSDSCLLERQRKGGGWVGGKQRGEGKVWESWFPPLAWKKSPPTLNGCVSLHNNLQLLSVKILWPLRDLVRLSPPCSYYWISLLLDDSAVTNTQQGSHRDGFLTNLYTWRKLQLTDSPHSSIHGPPSVEVTHISLFFLLFFLKLNVRSEAPPKHMGLSTHREPNRTWFPGKLTCTFESSLNKRLSQPLLCRFFTRMWSEQATLNSGYACVFCRITPESQWF